MSTIAQDIIKSRISEALQIPLAKLHDDTPVRDVVRESFALVEMVIDLQEEFGVQLRQEDLKEMRTIGSFVALIAERTRNAGGALSG